MTQSDAPNEGREEKIEEDARLLYERSFKRWQQSNVPLENIIVEEITNYVRDQLSKERDFNEKLKKGLENGSERWKKHLELENKVLKEQLEKEREMRKELVENAIATLCSKFPEYGNREFSVREIRALLEPLKASRTGQE